MALSSYLEEDHEDHLVDGGPGAGVHHGLVDVRVPHEHVAFEKETHSKTKFNPKRLFHLTLGDPPEQLLERRHLHPLDHPPGDVELHGSLLAGDVDQVGVVGVCFSHTKLVSTTNKNTSSYEHAKQ